MKNYGIITCNSCGKSFKRTGPRQIRCPECAEELNRLKAREHAREKAAIKKLEKERGMTEKKPSEQQAKYECKKDDCIYKGTAGGIKICDYFGITGKLRGCPVQGCIKYTKGNKSRRQNEFKEV